MAASLIYSYSHFEIFICIYSVRGENDHANINKYIQIYHLLCSKCLHVCLHICWSPYCAFNCKGCCEQLIASFFSFIMAGPGMLSLSRTEKYCTKLADEVMKLRGEKALMDFRIHSKDDEFPCAKFVMAAHSPMLRAMLISDMAEVAKQEIRLDHISKDIIQIVLDYMYCEDVSFHRDQLMDLIVAADYFQMGELKEMCLDEVPDALEPGNVISW